MLAYLLNISYADAFYNTWVFWGEDCSLVLNRKVVLLVPHFPKYCTFLVMVVFLVFFIRPNFKIYIYFIRGIYMYADIGLWDFFSHPNMMEVNGVLFILYFIFESIEIIVLN